MQATLGQAYQAEGILYMSLELSLKQWKLSFGTGCARRRRVTVQAGDRQRVLEEVTKAKKHFGLADTALVRSCYEAGREAFWVHRWLKGVGIDNLVVDSCSIEVNRRRKRVKTDRVDGDKLLELLERYFAGHKRAFAVVRVPPQEVEDERQLSRGREQLTQERTALRNRITGLLFAQGVRWEGQAFEGLRDWEGQALGEQLMAQLKRDFARLQLVEEQLRAVKASQARRCRQLQDALHGRMRGLMKLRSLGQSSSWVLVLEMFGWRRFENRREVGAAAGLTPTPYCSGELAHEQGIGKNGLSRVRVLMIELAWMWRRHQPHSALSRWYEKRFAKQGARARRIGIVALARKLLIALWRYLQDGVIPEGACLKGARA
jgi:transposase